MSKQDIEAELDVSMPTVRNLLSKARYLGYLPTDGAQFDYSRSLRGLKVIRRIKMARLDRIPDDGKPWVADYRSFDIPETVAACIRNAAPGLVAITIATAGGGPMIVAAERAARKRSVRIIWLHRRSY